MNLSTALRLGALVVSLGLAVALQARAADAPATDSGTKRPRIGLVLGGGGAKGAAHIGVIKVLEELRIPVDCIAGTSMGSIVGAAYATGMSAAKLEQIVTAVDWKDILASAPREEQPVQRKKLDFAFTLGLELGLRDGDVILPGGLVPTHQIEALFRRILAGAGEVSHFDRLPIPFRAVATDLESGEMKVFDRGDLALAMRASMAVPGAFSPVDTGGRLYVDGMLVRNLPVDVARKTCADVVIAVPVGNPATTRAKLDRLTAVAGQAMNIAVEANEKAQIATLTARDVHIPVVLQNISSADFALVPQAIPIGEAAARQVIESLSRYSLTAPEYARWRAGLREVADVPKVTIDEVRLAGMEVTNPEVMRSFIQVQPGQTFDPERSDADATHLVARGDFTSVSYRLSTEGGRNVLTYDAVEKPWGPNYLLFDFNLSTDLRGDTAWGIRFDYERRWLNSLGGEFRGSFQLGRPNAVSGEWYQPLDLAQRYFVAPSAFASQTIEYLYDGDTRAAEVDTRRIGIALDVGRAIGTTGEARLGLLAGSARVESNIGIPLLPETGQSQLGAVTLRLTHDSLDQRLFPSKGQYALVRANLSRTGLGADRSYDVASVALSSVHTQGADVWTVAARAGYGFGDSVPSYDQFRLGGLFNFSGYQPNQLIGQNYAWSGLQYRRRIGYLFETLGTAAWGGATLEAGNVFDRLDGQPAHGALVGGSVFLGINSKLGPVFLGYGLSESGHRALYLYIGSSLELF